MHRSGLLAHALGFAILCTPVFLNARAAAAEPAPSAFRFVQICDTQLGFGEKGYDQDVESFRRAVRQINVLRPAFVVICGDQVNQPEAQASTDFKQVMAGFEIPCHCAAGNHDVGHPGTAASLARYRETIGKTHYCFKHQNHTFLVVNTELWKTPVEGETSAQDTWFEESLQQAKADSSPVVVVGHHPLFLKAPDEEEEYFNIPPGKRVEILRLFAENGVVALLSGHTHRLVENEYEGIQFLSGETTSKNFDKRPLGFRLWEVDGQGLMSHRFVALEQ